MDVENNRTVRTTISLKASELALIQEAAKEQGKKVSSFLVRSALGQTERQLGESLGNCEIHFEGIVEYSTALKLCAEFLHLDPLNRITELKRGDKKASQRLNVFTNTFATALLLINELIKNGATIVRFSFYHTPPPLPSQHPG